MKRILSIVLIFSGRWRYNVFGAIDHVTKKVLTVAKPEPDRAAAEFVKGELRTKHYDGLDDFKNRVDSVIDSTTKENLPKVKN